MSFRRWPAVLLASIGFLAACGGGSPTSTPASSIATTAGATSAPSTTPPTSAQPAEPFVSTHYGYSLTSTDWTGTDATTAWDGTGAPGDGDPTVDVLEGPEGQRAFALGEPTKASLHEYVVRSRKVNATVHPCSTEPEKTGPITIGGEPAILDELHCPARVGPFVINAIVIHAGHAYSFFTYSVAPGSEAFTRAWFHSLLKTISFDV